jgi:hypothetical protein
VQFARAEEEYTRALQCLEFYPPSPSISAAHTTEAIRVILNSALALLHLNQPEVRPSLIRASNPPAQRVCTLRAQYHIAMQKLRIVTCGISGGRSLTRPFRDARRFPSTQL